MNRLPLVQTRTLAGRPRPKAFGKVVGSKEPAALLRATLASRPRRARIPAVGAALTKTGAITAVSKPASPAIRETPIPSRTAGQPVGDVGLELDATRLSARAETVASAATSPAVPRTAVRTLAPDAVYGLPGPNLVPKTAVTLSATERLGASAPFADGRPDGPKTVVKRLRGRPVAPATPSRATRIAIAAIPVRVRTQAPLEPQAPPGIFPTAQVATAVRSSLAEVVLAKPPRLGTTVKGLVSRAGAAAPPLEPIPRGELGPVDRRADGRTPAIRSNQAIVSAARRARTFPAPTLGLVARVFPPERLNPQVAKPVPIGPASLAVLPGAPTAPLPAAAKGPPRSRWLSAVLLPVAGKPKVAGVLRTRVAVAAGNPGNT